MLLATKLRFALTATVLKRMNGDLSPFGMVLCLRIPGRGFEVSRNPDKGTTQGGGSGTDADFEKVESGGAGVFINGRGRLQADCQEKGDKYS